MIRNIGLTLIGFGFIGAFAIGCSDDSPTRTQGNQGPTPPTRLSARFVTATQIRLDWNDNSQGEDGFEIFEAIGTDSNYVKVATTAENAENAFLDNMSSVLKYYFKVRAFSENGVSTFCQPVILEGGSMLARLKIPEGTVRCAAFSPDGINVATGSGDYKVRLWDWATESEIRPFLYHQRAVTSLGFSPGGRWLATTDEIQVVVWDLNAGQYYTSFIGTRPKFSPDGSLLLAIVDTTVTLFDPTNFNVKHVLNTSGDNREFGFSADGHYLLASSPLRKYDLTSRDDTLSEVATIKHYFDPADTSEGAIPWGGEVTVFSPNGEYALSGAELIRLSDSTKVAHFNDLSGICFAISPDGTKLLSGTTDWKIILWEVGNPNRSRVLAGHTMPVYSVAWDGGSRYAVSASGDGSARVWGPFF